MNTVKTEITNLMTNMINAKKSHILIWGEENGSTVNGNIEWSFGNGTDDDINFGLCIPVTGKITKATLSSTTSSEPSGEMKVNILINGTEETGHQIKKKNGNYSDTTIFQTPLDISEGDRINFISRTTNTSVTHAVVSVLIEF